MEKKNIAKYSILNYMLHQGNTTTTKAELAKQLNLSMPTVLSNINELTEKGLVLEVGEMESTGGRKARKIALNEDYFFAIGVDITAHHMGMVLINLGGKVVKQKRVRFDFQSNIIYCRQLGEYIQEFYKNEVIRDKVLGIGISLPGIVDTKERILIKSHALQVENYSLKMMEQFLPFSIHFENDANAAMLSENTKQLGNAVYLSLSHTLGGAVCMDGNLFAGQNRKAGEFGHMILVPGGKPCYCGKYGCADAYCAASVLTKERNGSLDIFMELIGKENDVNQVWEEYLENLAVLISNIRMIFDTDIILGGDVGGYLEGYMVELGEKILKYNRFDRDISYLKNGTYRQEASAVGVAKYFLQQVVERV